jgi:hypothetical protein
VTRVSRPPGPPELRWLTVASIAEAVTLVVLLVNRASVHLPAVTSAVGPLHGFVYLVTIATAFLAPLATRTRLLALVPGVGGLLALRSARAPRAAADRPDERRADPDGYRGPS